MDKIQITPEETFSRLDSTADVHCMGLRKKETLKTEESAKFKIHKVFVKATMECI